MKACVFTLGCKVNEAESASLMAGLEALGYCVTDELSPADLYILNTCAVTAEAEKKSRQAVARMRRYNPQAKIVVCGCASQRAPEAFAGRENVVLVTGAMHKQGVLDLLGREGIHLQAETAFCEMPAPRETRARTNIRIQDGCDRFCSYCIIPYLRGRTRSRSVASVVEEAGRCTAQELVLTGIDITSYRDGDKDLGDLLLALSRFPFRVRLGSLEEGVVTDGFLGKMKRAGNCCEHFHLSLQSGSDAVLKKMNRRYTRAEYLQTCARIYETFPDAAVTTDIIVGFPTETEEDFEQTLAIVDEAGFARVHAFPYSRRAGTNAAKLPDLPASVKKERMARLAACAEEAERRYLARFAGRTLEAVFDGEGGYTRNYIRVYAAGAREGGRYLVRLTGLVKDGASAEIVKQ